MIFFFTNGDQPGAPFGKAFLFAFMLALVAVVFAWGFAAARKRRRAYERISAFLRQHGNLVDGKPTVRHREIDFRLTFFGNRRQQPAGLRIRFEGPTPGSFSVRRKRLPETEGLFFGFAKRIRTQDPSFDHRFRVSAGSPTFASAFMDVPVVRDRIRGLFDMGFNNLVVDPDGLSVKLSPLTLFAEREPMFLLDALDGLVDLVNGFRRI